MNVNKSRFLLNPFSSYYSRAKQETCIIEAIHVKRFQRICLSIGIFSFFVI